MRMFRQTLPALAVLLFGGSLASADDGLPPDRPIEEVVDHYIDAGLKAAHVLPAPPADDANLVRRLTLDLVGRIPTWSEARAYIDSADPNKRPDLVDRLLASPGFVRHQAAEFDLLLMSGTRASLRDYLLRAFRENRPWDRVFRELLLPDEKDPGQKGASTFLRQRVRDLDRLTNDVSTLFFGVNISCARCHDHPLVADWKQDHFYGMKAFFDRTFERGGYLGERESGVVRFKTRAGQEKQARLMFLNGVVVAEPSLPGPAPAEQKKERAGRKESRKKTTPPAPPRFSARAQLVRVALEPGQRDFFARSVVNRVWLRLFGYGLVMPVDQMHSENAPSHPELLAWLARDTAEHGYDLRRLIRGLVLSRAYARSSRWEGGPAPKPQLFAVARARPLTPTQLAASLRLATADPDSLGTGLKREEFERRIEALENSARGFAGLLEPPRDDFQIGVAEALLFSNSERVSRDFLADGGDRLVGRLKKMHDPRALVEMAVRNVLSRPPSPDELELLSAYLARRQDRPTEACRQLVWALLTSTEFRFNY